MEQPPDGLSACQGHLNTVVSDPGAIAVDADLHLPAAQPAGHGIAGAGMADCRHPCRRGATPRWPPLDVSAADARPEHAPAGPRGSPRATPH
jgi:hypothetical protein